MASQHSIQHAHDIVNFIRSHSELEEKKDGSSHEASPCPLWFDRVNDGGRPYPNTAFFRLPSELLDHVTGFLGKSDLGALALVNSYCRQLARARQFASVHLDYNSDASQGLWGLLSSEVADRLANGGHTSQPSLGVCIRRLTVATVIPMLPLFAAWWKGTDLPELFAPPPNNKRQHALEMVAHRYFDTYIEELCGALRHALPSLELLRWEDKVHVTPEHMASIARSPVRDLKLCQVLVSQEFEVGVPPEEQRWELHKLSLKILSSSRNKDGSTAVSAVPLCLSILRAAAPTLESLEWSRMDFGQEKINFRGQVPQFPQLRNLVLSNVKMSDQTLLDAFIPPDGEGRLRSLSLESVSGDYIRAFLTRRGHVESLRSFNSETINSDDISFLAANPQLTSFTTPHANSPKLLDSQILPVLTTFRHLTSLHLVWQADTIGLAALELIGSIHTLKHLWLSAGIQSGTNRSWIVDHRIMLAALKPLRMLEKLVLTRDSYELRHPEILAHLYYEVQELPIAVTVEDILGPDESSGEDVVEDEDRWAHEALRDVKAWEKWHRNRMQRYATYYSRALPKLGFVFLGQVPMAVYGYKHTRGADYRDKYDEDGPDFYGSDDVPGVLLPLYEDMLEDEDGDEDQPDDEQQEEEARDEDMTMVGDGDKIVFTKRLALPISERRDDSWSFSRHHGWCIKDRLVTKWLADMPKDLSQPLEGFGDDMIRFLMERGH